MGDISLNSNVESSSMEGERNASDDRLTKEGEALHKSESSPNKKEINKNSMSEESRVIDNKSSDAIGVNEIDSSISKSVVLSSEDVTRDEDDRTKEDSMEVDAECTGSESHIETSSTIT